MGSTLVEEIVRSRRSTQLGGWPRRMDILSEGDRTLCRSDADTPTTLYVHDVSTIDTAPNPRYSSGPIFFRSRLALARYAPVSLYMLQLYPRRFFCFERCRSLRYCNSIYIWIVYQMYV